MTGPSEMDPVLTIDELAEYLKIAKSVLCKLAQEGRLPGQKIGKRWRFRKQAIDQWLDRKSNSKANSTKR
jgi:excisionase family DNA binding protein